MREVERCHLNYVVSDTDRWEQSATFYLDTDEHVLAFVKTFNLGFAIPYTHEAVNRKYVPDFLVRMRRDGHEVGTLILGVKGYDPAARAKIDAAQRWVAAMNAEGPRGRWVYRCVRHPTEVPAALRSAAVDLALPPPTPWPETLRRFVEEVKAVYGDYLHSVVLYGSRARGDAVPGSDVDALVVLRDLDDFWRELGRLSDIAAGISLGGEAVVSATPADLQAWERGATPLLRNARRDGRLVS